MLSEMQNQEIATEQAGKQMNAKAEKFQKSLEDNNINLFSTELIEDTLKSSVFRSRIEVKGQQLPAVIIIDESIFTIIRTQIVTGIDADKRADLLHCVNEMNEKFKIFKYYLAEDGTLLMDVCIPFVDETFDSNMIHLMVDVLVRHLDETYPRLMQKVWGV
ncbi:hypothetical protein SRRS_11160 [Sporomusa rhizae]|uniref:hypothetical protein n=1 Tax=Sporomusa rhizae TaxID=357999 RepID=UPI00352A0447